MRPSRLPRAAADRSPVPVALAAVGGAALAASLGAVGILRRDKALHAYGRVTTGALHRAGGAGTGVPLLDEPGPVRCLVRESRATSLAHRGPDVMGVALRLTGAAADGGDADLLLASTGTSDLGRHLLAVRTSPRSGPLTTLLPQDSPSGPVLLRLDAAGRSAYDLSWSRASGPWRPAGRLVLDLPWGVDRPVRFAPVARPPAGLRPPAWVRALRQPAYALAHRAVTPATDRTRS